MKPKQLRTSEEQDRVKKQPVTACADCPFTRASLPGWLGGSSAGDFLAAAHSHSPMDCHTRCFEDGSETQCAGAAIYRRNVCQSISAPTPSLERDKEKVFASPLEFAAHHLRRPEIGSAEVGKIILEARLR